MARAQKINRWWLWLVLLAGVLGWCGWWYVGWVLDHRLEALRIEASKQPWMDELLDRELAGARPVSEEVWGRIAGWIEDGTLPHLGLFRIEADRIVTVPVRLSKRGEVWRGYLERLRGAGVPLPLGRFLLGERDAWRFPEGLDASIKAVMPPVLVFAASRLDPDRGRLVLAPDDHTVGDHWVGYRRGWRSIYGEMERARESWPWERRNAVAFWRGLPTDRIHKTTPDSLSPRERLVDFSVRYPKEVDAAWTETPLQGWVVKTIRPLLQRLSIPPYVSHSGQVAYRILPNLDGVTCTYPGLLWRLLSGAVVIKQETQNEQWFYGLLEPGIHYLPVGSGLEDFMDRVRWVYREDEAARQIAAASVQLVHASLTPDHVDAYTLRLLERTMEATTPASVP